MDAHWYELLTTLALIAAVLAVAFAGAGALPWRHRELVATRVALREVGYWLAGVADPAAARLPDAVDPDLLLPDAPVPMVGARPRRRSTESLLGPAAPRLILTARHGV